MKKLIAITLALAMLVSLGAEAFAARDTEFFTPSEHTELRFDELRYEPVDADAAAEFMERTLELAADAENLAKVEELFALALDAHVTGVTMYMLAYIEMCADPASDEAVARYDEATEAQLRVTNAFYSLVRDLVATPCAGMLHRWFTPAELGAFAGYATMSEDEILLLAGITGRESGYWRLETADLTREELHAKRAEEYIETVRLNRRRIEDAGWDRSAADYFYLNTYSRDYGAGDAIDFAAAVREHAAPLYRALCEKLASSPDSGFDAGDYSGDRALGLIAPYIEDMSDELAESLEFMRTRGYYDSSVDPRKSDQSFTAELPAFNAPFYFRAGSGGFSDLTTAIHEFGHYNNDYWCADLRGVFDKSIDVAEVHSQGLELLFSEYYDELLGGEEEAREARLHLLTLKLGSVVEGAMIDELERWCYAQDELTAESIDEKAAELLRDYCIDGMADPDYWTGISHIFTKPFYYISYAVSAAGAFSFWLTAQRDFRAGTDSYLRFTALPYSKRFRSAFTAVGADFPMSAEYIERLAAAAGYAAGLRGWHYDDVGVADWYFPAVDAYCRSVEGEENGLFEPDREATPEFAASVAEGLDDLTRAGVVTALYERYAAGEFFPAAPFRDIDSLGERETLAVEWAYAKGIIRGTSAATFAPDAVCSRAMLLTIVMRTLEAVNAEN